MKKVLIINIFLFLLMSVQSQTVIRMRMPQQSEQALEVVTLFSESLPVGIPIVLGAIGFDITGGTAPFLLEWLKDDVVVATGDIAVITPETGKNYILRISDNAGCYIEQSIQIDSKSKVKANYLDEIFRVAPTVISNELSVKVNSIFPLKARIRAFSTEGILCLDEEMLGEYHTGINWGNGIYFVVISAGELHQVTKIIVAK